MEIKDVLKVASNAYKLLLENDKVRVMDIKLKPGETAKMHNHPNGHVVYVINDAKLTLRFPDGKSQEFELKSGQTLWIDAGAHETTNTGNSLGHNLVIEVKE